MVIKPMIRSNICINAHPVGCAKETERQIKYAVAQKAKRGIKTVKEGGKGPGNRGCGGAEADHGAGAEHRRGQTACRSAEGPAGLRGKPLGRMGGKTGGPVLISGKHGPVEAAGGYPGGDAGRRRRRGRKGGAMVPRGWATIAQQLPCARAEAAWRTSPWSASSKRKSQKAFPWRGRWHPAAIGRRMTDEVEDFRSGGTS